jgi:hypothetical protein
MSPQTRCEFGIQLGEFYWKFFEFKTNPTSRDMYLIVPIPDVALHLSIHSPKPPTLPNWHQHLRSEPLGIDEDINDGVFSPEDCTTWAMEWLENFKYYEPSSDENVTVFPLMTDALRIETLGKREKTVFDVGRFIQTIGNGAFYRTKVKRLPLLMKAKPYGDIGICAFSENGMILPFDSETMIEIDPRSINMEKLTRSSLCSILDPMEKALTTIQRTNPSSLQRWFPSPQVEGFLEETINTLKHSKPKIVDF